MLAFLTTILCSDVVDRAIAVSQMFEDRTKQHESSKKKDQALPLDLQADASFCESTLKLVDIPNSDGTNCN